MNVCRLQVYAVWWVDGCWVVYEELSLMRGRKGELEGGRRRGDIYVYVYTAGKNERSGRIERDVIKGKGVRSSLQRFTTTTSAKITAIYSPKHTYLSI